MTRLRELIRSSIAIVPLDSHELDMGIRGARIALKLLREECAKRDIEDDPYIRLSTIDAIIKELTE